MLRTMVLLLVLGLTAAASTAAAATDDVPGLAPHVVDALLKLEHKLRVGVCERLNVCNLIPL